MHKSTIVLLGVLVALVFGISGYYLGLKTGIDKKTSATASATATVTSTATITTKASATTSATADETANWKTYTNDTYGFSFKYPTTWNLNDDTGYIHLTDSAKTYQLEGSGMDPIVIGYAKDTFGASIDKYVAQGSGALKPLLQKATVTIGGKVAYVIKGITPPVDHNERVIFYNGIVINCSSNADNLSGQDPEGAITKIFDQILSTFQFTK